MSAPLTIGILECWTNRPEWRDHGDFADWFPPFLRKARRDLQFSIYHAHQGDLPNSVTECDVWLVTGSAASVYEDWPWQSDLVGFLRRAATVVPLIGICYGHQIVHHALGGRVAHHDTWGIGVHTYDVVSPPDWSATPATRLRLIASHQDQVTVPALGSRILAQSAFCPCAVTQIGDVALTFQAHPEMTKELAALVYPTRREAQGDALTDRALDSLASDVDDLTAARWILDFVAHARAQQEVSA